MDLLKNLAEASKEDQMNYLNSFDQVLCDMDGVIWHNYNPIAAASECTQNLQKLGKKIRYITNNTLNMPDYFLKKLTDGNFLANVDDIVNPIVTTITYLKSVDVKNELYVVSNQPMKDALIEAGHKLVPDPPSSIEETVSAILEHYDSSRNVGAVILDLDININYIKLQKAYWYLQNPDCKFIVTPTDKRLPVGPKQQLIGPYYFAEAIKDFSGRDYTEIGKPSLTCINYIKTKYNITNPSRILFIGDSIQSDMSTAAIGGFQKLLVLSGITTLTDIKNWQYPEEFKPEYYAEDMKVLNDIIKSVYTNL